MTAAEYVSQDELERLAFEYGVPIHVRPDFAYVDLGDRRYATELEAAPVKPHDRNPATPQAGLACEGEWCTIHNPSEHHMNAWPIARGGERVCPHGIGHPDPDYLAWLDRVKPGHVGGVHGCDLCCRPGSGVPS